MSEMTMILTIALAIVFLVLALVAMLKYDSVKHFFKAFGFEIGIHGETDHKNRTKKAKQDSDRPRSFDSGKASVKIGGTVSGSSVAAEGSGEGHIEIGKDMSTTRLRARGTRAASTHVEGDVQGSDIDVRALDE